MFGSQFTLLDALPEATVSPHPDPHFEGVRRTELTNDAWLDLSPSWLSGDAALFDHLTTAVEWRRPEMAMYDRVVATPRLTASVDASAHPVFGEVVDLLSDRYGKRLERISANWYRNGNDSVAWHGDRVARDLPEAIVATVSLRGPREFRYKPADGGASRRCVLGNGDLVVMGGSFQRTWRHAVPKASGSVPPRMVVMFRHAY